LYKSAKIQQSQFLNDAGVKSHSYQGRNLYGYNITDTNYSECYKQNVVITARQHPIESINGYFIEGLTDYLLFSQDTVAEFLRRNFRFYIYPMLNPDGVFNGSGQNALGQGLNREWEDSLISGGVPEIDSIRPVIWQETAQKVNWSIDIHSNPGSNVKYYWWGYKSTSPVPQWQISKAEDYVLAVALSDSSSPENTSLYQDSVQGDGVNTSLTAANWFRKSFNAIAFTFEPTSEPMGYSGNNAITTTNMRNAGASLIKGFASVFDSVQAMGGSIGISGNTLLANITGGYPPYTYQWTGPHSGTNDTLHNAISGIYTLQVTDTKSCTWTQQLDFVSTGYTGPVFMDNVMRLFPNPSNGMIWIESEHKILNAEIEVFDLAGRCIYHHELSLENRTYIKLSDDYYGLYLIKITAGEYSFVKKFVLIR